MHGGNLQQAPGYLLQRTVTASRGPEYRTTDTGGKTPVSYEWIQEKRGCKKYSFGKQTEPLPVKAFTCFSLKTKDYFTKCFRENNMGGWGSGRIFWFGSTRRVAESSLPVDIRELKRKGLLIPGGWITSKWSRNGQVHSSIGASVYDDKLVLKYTYQKTENVEQPIRFAWTWCNFGGKRIWFVCPYCGRRCAVVYSCGKYFAYRICRNVAYQTQNETWQDRLFTKANKLREKIGADPGAFNPLSYFKSKHMRYKTWDRIKWQIITLEDKGMDIAEQMLGLRL
jgi:hypothetical protein